MHPFVGTFLKLIELNVLTLHLHQFPNTHPEVRKEEKDLVLNPAVPEVFLCPFVLGVQPFPNQTSKGTPLVCFPRLPLHLAVDDEVLFLEREFWLKGTNPFSIAHFQHSLIVPTSFCMATAFGWLGTLVLFFTRQACQSFHLR